LLIVLIKTVSSIKTRKTELKNNYYKQTNNTIILIKMASITSNDYRYLSGYEEGSFKNFEDKNERDLIYTSGLLMEVIFNYKDMSPEEKKKSKEIICNYFKECSNRKEKDLAKNIPMGCLTIVYKNLWDFCIKHDLKPLSTSDGVYYFKNEFNLVLSAEEEDLYEDLINWEFFSSHLNVTKSGPDLSKINKLLDVFKKMIEHPYTKCDLLLGDLQKLEELRKEYREAFGKKYLDVIENFFSVFCIENGLSHCSGYSLIPKTKCKPFFITSSVKKNLDMIRAIATLKIVSDENKCKVIKEQLERCTIEFKKSKYLCETHPESFHAIRAKVNCKEIEKCIVEIKTFYLINIYIVDGDVKVSMLN
jgi:hypothetical protein